jgi:hypothetical protein
MISYGYRLLISSIYYLSLDPGAALISWIFLSPSDKTKALNKFTLKNTF